MTTKLAPWGKAIEVIEVPRTSLETYAGRDWPDVRGAALIGADGLCIKATDYGEIIYRQQRDRPDWQPALDKNLNPVDFLPMDRAWLREVDGKAFLYLQNWTVPNPFTYWPQP